MSFVPKNKRILGCKYLVKYIISPKFSWAVLELNRNEIEAAIMIFVYIILPRIAWHKFLMNTTILQ